MFKANEDDDSLPLPHPRANRIPHSAQRNARTILTHGHDFPDMQARSAAADEQAQLDETQRQRMRELDGALRCF